MNADSPTVRLHFDEHWALVKWREDLLYVRHTTCKRRRLYESSLLCERWSRKGESRLRCNVCRKRFPTLFACQITLLGARPSSPAAILVIPGKGLL